MTKIDNEPFGARNEQALFRSGNLWWVPDGGMYVYYRPTHWRELTDEERAVERSHIEAREANTHKQAMRAHERLA